MFLLLVTKAKQNKVKWQKKKNIKKSPGKVCIVTIHKHIVNTYTIRLYSVIQTNEFAHVETQTSSAFKNDNIVTGCFRLNC